MPGRPQRSVYLGQFTDELANEIAGALHEAGIAWTYKQTSAIGKALFAGEWGTRLFVDADRLDEAKAVVVRVQAEQQA